MVYPIKFIVLCISLAAILFVGFSIRRNNLYTWPREGATFDEFVWTWLGMTILDTKIPMSWSPHKQYIHRTMMTNAKGTHFVLVTPWLEHPPLFGLIAGFSAKNFGATSYDIVTLQNMRPLALILGILSILLVFALAAEVFGVGVGLLAACIYAITPTIAVGSRIVQNENFFIPAYMLLLWLVTRYLRDELAVGYCRRNRLTDRTLIFARNIGILLLCFLLPLAKIPWIAAPAAVAGIFIYHKKYRESLFVGGIAVLSILFYIWWGYLWNWDVFLNLMKLQTARYDMSFDGFLSLVTTPIVTDRLYTDGWIYMGWFSIGLLFVKDWKNGLVVVFGFLSYMFIYLLGIPNEAGHGWYRYPFYPFMAIATAYVWKRYVLSHPFLLSIYALIIGLPMLQHLVVPKIGFSYLIYRGFIVFMALPIVTIFIPENYHISLRLLPNAIRLLIFGDKTSISLKELLMTGFSYLFFMIIIFLSYKAGLRYNEQ